MASNCVRAVRPHRKGRRRCDWFWRAISTVLCAGSSESTNATPARRGSSTFQGRRARRRRRTAPRSKVRRRARARRSRESRAVRSRTGTRSRRRRRGCATTRCPRPANTERRAGGRPGIDARAASAPTDRAEHGRLVGGHQAPRPKIAAPSASSDAHGPSAGGVEQQRGPRRRRPGAAAAAGVHDAAAASVMAAQPLPRFVVEGCTGRVGFDRGRVRQLRDEAVVLRREFAVDAARERVALQLVLQVSRGVRRATCRSPGTTGTRQRRRAGRPLPRSRGCSPTSRGCGTRRGSSWCQNSWRTASSLFSNRSGDARPVVEQAAGSRSTR